MFAVSITHRATLTSDANARRLQLLHPMHQPPTKPLEWNGFMIFRLLRANHVVEGQSLFFAFDFCPRPTRNLLTIITEFDFGTVIPKQQILDILEKLAQSGLMIANV